MNDNTRKPPEIVISPTAITGSFQNEAPETPQVTQEEINKVLKEFEEIKKVKEEFLQIFGLFAAILIFSSIEIKAFSQITKFSLLMGISMFFLSTFMLFVLTLNNIIRSKDYRDYKSAAFVLCIFFFLFSMECFWWATHPGHLWLFISWGV